MLHRHSLVLAATLLASNALAGSQPDLAVSLTPPTGVHFFESGRYSVTVRNNGNRAAAAVTLTLRLPATHTSPTVFVLGDLGTYDSRCQLSGTTLTCALGSIDRNVSKVVQFYIALPQSSAPLTFTASASTTTSESNLTNNSLTHTASPLAYPIAIASTVPAVNRHCTGTGLTSFFECELFPSSLSSHSTILNADHTISIPDAPGYGGTWTQPTPDRLQFQYTDGTAVVATFDGRGVDGHCFHGLTTFPGSTYVSPYEVCLP